MLSLLVHTFIHFLEKQVKGITILENLYLQFLNYNYPFTK